jgi:hypothetical protein
MQEQVIRVIRPNSFYKYAVKPIHRLRGWDAALCLLITKNKDWQYSTTFGLRNQPSTVTRANKLYVWVEKPT